MADNYMLFSEELTGISPEGAEWLKRYLETPWCNDELSDEELEEFTKETEELFGACPDYTCDYHFYKSKDGNTFDLWLYSEEAPGAMDYVVRVLQEYFKRFDPNSCFRMSWSFTCSKPRLGEFSGGGVFITADTVKYVDVDGVLNNYHREWIEAGASKN